MPFLNLSHPDQRVSFQQAVQKGVGRGQGLFMPAQLQVMDDMDALLAMDFHSRSSAILKQLVGEDCTLDELQGLVGSAFDFPVPLVVVQENCHALELFHGTSLAFKDFGARFLAHCLVAFRQAEGTTTRTTILTATSGDTGAAVAQAFFRQPGIDVVVLYPRGRITLLQEKLFCTLGENITTYAVEGDFDACQAMVKEAFTDPELVQARGLNSANSINIARLLAQVCYYFEAVAQLPASTRPVFSVPSGNFGNVTAGLLAVALGLPVKRIIAATNANDTVPRYFSSGQWQPNATVATVTNAMDVSRPNNFQRVLALQERYGLTLEGLLSAQSLSDEQTRTAIRSLHAAGYLADPHSALAWQALHSQLQADETGVFLCTAHPAKFIEEMEATLNITLELPDALQQVANRELRSQTISTDFQAFKTQLLQA